MLICFDFTKSSLADTKPEILANDDDTIIKWLDLQIKELSGDLVVDENGAHEQISIWLSIDSSDSLPHVVLTYMRYAKGHGISFYPHMTDNIQSQSIGLDLTLRILDGSNQHSAIIVYSNNVAYDLYRPLALGNGIQFKQVAIV